MRVAKRPPGPGTEAGPAAGPAVPAALRSLKEFEHLPLAQMVALVRGGPLLGSSLRERATIVVMLGRLRTCVPGLLAFALGLSYTAPVAWWRGALGGLLSLLIAFSANLHNAYTDIEEDCYNLPGRTWLLARLGLARLKWTLVGVSAFMAVAAVPLGLPFLGLMLLAIAGLHQYSFPPLRFKAWPLAGLLVFAQAVGFPFLFGLLADPGAQLWFPSRRYLGMLAFLMFWFVAKGTFKNVPDFYGDRAVGLRTSATIFRTWRQAAGVAGVLTVTAYLSLAALVALGLAPVRLLLSLGWVPLAAWQCVRLFRADSGPAGNDVLRDDMRVSAGFLVSVLLLAAPRPASLVAVLAGGAVLVGVDLLRLDSRRARDAARGDAASPGGASGGASSGGVVGAADAGH